MKPCEGARCERSPAYSGKTKLAPYSGVGLAEDVLVTFLRILGVGVSRFIMALVFTCIHSLAQVGANGSDWMRFRGPNGSGISTEQVPTPTTWSDTENLKWKVSLPGPGSSCPIVVGSRVIVTSWSGYGVSREENGEQAMLRRNVTCVNRDTGDVLWNKSFEPYLPEDEYGGMFAEHGYASHTPVSDGERIYVFFGKTGAIALDLEGEQLWKRGLGTESGARGWGSASSPILYKNLLIVTASAESEAIVALDKTTGEEIWRQEASGLHAVWATPILVQVDSDRTDMVIAVPGEMWGINPNTGKLRWYCDALRANSICSSVVTQNGIVYAIETGPGGGGGIAVRAGGSGDVTDTQVVWSGNQAGRIGSPIIHDDKLYAISRGVANCFEAATGEQVYRGRLQASGTGPAEASEPQEHSRTGRRRGGRGGQDYASPVLANEKIYFLTRSGEMHVLAVGEEFDQLAVNRVTSEREDFSATPAVSHGQLFIRSSKHLYCVAQPDR